MAFFDCGFAKFVFMAGRQTVRRSRTSSWQRAGKPKAYRKGYGGAALQAGNELVSRRHTAGVAAEPHFKLAVDR